MQAAVGLVVADNALPQVADDLFFYQTFTSAQLVGSVFNMTGTLTLCRGSCPDNPGCGTCALCLLRSLRGGRAAAPSGAGAMNRLHVLTSCRPRVTTAVCPGGSGTTVSCAAVG